MKISKLMLLMALGMFTFAGCSEETMESMEKDVEVAGEKIEQGAAEAVEEIKELGDDIEEGAEDGAEEMEEEAAEVEVETTDDDTVAEEIEEEAAE